MMETRSGGGFCIFISLSPLGEDGMDGELAPPYTQLQGPSMRYLNGPMCHFVGKGQRRMDLRWALSMTERESRGSINRNQTARQRARRRRWRLALLGERNVLRPFQRPCESLNSGTSSMLDIDGCRPGSCSLDGMAGYGCKSGGVWAMA